MPRSPGTFQSARARRALYHKMSSVVAHSFLDDTMRAPGSPGIHHANMTVVVPNKAITASLRQPTTREATTERHLISFVVVYTMIFFNGCCFTAVVPSVPFYLQVLGAPPSFLGWVVSFYSLGQIIGSPTAGWLADKLPSKLLLTLSSTLGLLSSLLYATAPNHYAILASRWLTGISAGMEFTTELTYISRNTTTEERTTFLASVTACNVVGFIMGPALTTILATLDFSIMGLVVNQYTGPGWLLVSMFLCDLIMVRCLYKDSHKPGADYGDDTNHSASSSLSSPPSVNEKSGLLKGSSGQQGTSYSDGLKKKLEQDKQVNFSQDDDGDGDEPPMCSLAVVLSLIFVQFTVMCAWSVLETITSPLAYDEFGWEVQQCNLLFTCGGAISLVAYVGFVVASKWVQDRWLIVYALVLCFIGLMLMIDWPQLVWFPEGAEAALPSYFSRFITGYMIMNAGFMTGRPVTFALYSKLIPSRYQGEYLGWMVAGGSAARTLGPFAAVYLYYDIQGPGNNMLALFGTEGAFQLACLVLVTWCWANLLSSASRGAKDIDKGGTESANGDVSMHVDKWRASSSSPHEASSHSGGSGSAGGGKLTPPLRKGHSVV